MTPFQLLCQCHSLALCEKLRILLTTQLNLVLVIKENSKIVKFQIWISFNFLKLRILLTTQLNLVLVIRENSKIVNFV